MRDLGELLASLEGRALGGVRGGLVPLVPLLLWERRPGPTLFITSRPERRAQQMRSLGGWPELGEAPGAVRSLGTLALWELQEGAPLLVVHPRELLAPLPRELPRLEVVRGQRLDVLEAMRTLVDWGYRRVDYARQEGEFALRGGILDVISPSGPWRLELWDEEVVSLRGFDPWTQRSREEVERAVVLPWGLARGEATLLDHLPPGLRAVVEEPLLEPLPSLGGARITRLRPGPGELDLGTRANEGLRERLGPSPLRALREEARGRRLWLVCRTEAQARRLGELLPAAVRVGELEEGFLLEELGIWVVTEEELFGPRVPLRRGRPRAAMGELAPGRLAVHAHWGIARYEGLREMELGGRRGEFLVLRYAEGDRLYVPADRSDLVHPYWGPEGHQPPLDSLRQPSWQRRRRRVRRELEPVVRELVRLYAERRARPGYGFSPPDELFREFEASFPYEETPDQRAAVEEVLRDMQSPHPMERLVCGDVGYGKTEVAVRAAFKAVMDGKQVALLAPTTLLAYQHWRTFRGRMEPYPVEVGLLCRFVDREQRRRTLQGIAEGRVDIAIGTHLLLRPEVRFRDLGLVIIDEEHRFGVRAKERLKELRRQVDVLLLSATPIPRTLQLALMGIKDLSLMETPPPDRLPVQTYVGPFEEGLVREAIRRELARGGQVLFIHNRVRTLRATAARVQRMVPEARIAVAHGQMPERELERTLLAFLQGEAQVLVSTAIVEAGMDFTQANTLVVDRAHEFGLADLHQLRGRVGRSSRQAYAYFLVPPEEALTEEARRRLQSLQEYAELGSGFQIALQDLRIRGAGTLFGHRQSGHIASLGLEEYMRILEEAVREVRGERTPPEVDPRLELQVEAYLPASYVPEEAERLGVYRRLAGAREPGQLRALEEELRDRFGPLPDPARCLLRLARLRLRCRELLVERVEQRDGVLRLRFHPQASESLQQVLRALEAHPGARLSPEGVLSLPLGAEGPLEALERALG